MSGGEWNIPMDVKIALFEMLTTTSSDLFVNRLGHILNGNQTCREFIDGILQILEAIKGKGYAVVIDKYTNIFITHHQASTASESEI